VGKRKKVTVGYWYSLGWHSVLCQGGADAIEEIKYANRTAWSGNVTSNSEVYIDRPDLLGGEKREGGLQGYVEFLFGEDTQPVSQYLAYQCNVPITPVLNDHFSYIGGWDAWKNFILAGQENSYLTENGGRPVPAYRGVVSLVFRAFSYAAMNPYMKDLSVRVRRLPRTLNATTFDINLGGVHHANPAHIIYEVLTNRMWGMGFLPDDIDIASFTSAAATLHSEGFGLSLAWTDEGTAEDFINLVKSHIDAVVYPAPDTGRYTIKLIRRDYTVSELYVADQSNIINLRSFQRASPTDLVNEVTVEYHDMTQDKPVKITVQNLAGIQSTGRVVRKVVSMPGIRNGSLAARVAQRELMLLSSPLAKVVLDLNTTAWNLRPGDAFVLTWPKLGINQLVMRAIEVEYQDIRSGVVTVMAVEDIFGIPLSSFVTPSVPDWLAPVSSLSDISAYVITELPYYVLIQSNSEDYASYLSDNRNYLGIIAGRSSTLWQNYTAHELIGSAYTELSAATFAPWISALATIPKTITNTVVSYEAFFDDTEISVGDLGIVNGEWVQVAAINITERTITLVRGVLDTVPAEHPAGSRVWVYGEGILEDYSTERFASETVTLKLVPETPSETLPIATAVARTYTLTGRQQRPYPPGNFTINGARYPASAVVSSGAITVGWAHRDRGQQTVTVIAQSAASIGPESGVTYNLRAYVGAALIQSYVGLTGTSQVVPAISTMSLLHLNGANGATTFPDDVGNLWTRIGNAQISTAQSVFDGASCLFDGAGDYIYTAHRDVFNGLTDFTVECRVWTNVNNAVKCIVKKGTTFANTGWWLSLDTSGRLTFNMADATGIMTCQGATTLTTATWHRVAVVRSGNTITIFLNGVADGTFTLPRNPAINLTGSNLLVIGQDGVNTTRDWNGYIDEFRFSLLAHYTGPYADPGVPFSLASDLPPSTLRIELESERSGLVSWQRHNHTVNLS